VTWSERYARSATDPPHSGKGSSEARKTGPVLKRAVFWWRNERAIRTKEIERASTFEIGRAPVLGDAAYGENTRLRTALEDGGLTTCSRSTRDDHLRGGHGLYRAERSRGARGPAPRALRSEDKPVSVERFARALTDEDFQTVSFRGKSKKRLRSRFAFQRVTAAHPVTRDNQTPREEWLIIEWPAGRDAPSDYWISNLPADTKPERLARLARLRWMIELDYHQLKDELGLDHYEGRSYLGWYHHTALVTTAHAFLTLERQNTKAQRRASHSPRRSASSSPSSTAGPDTATPATSR
jgi:SRSO17 transposase